jgi:hypothetical protein
MIIREQTPLLRVEHESFEGEACRHGRTKPSQVGGNQSCMEVRPAGKVKEFRKAAADGAKLLYAPPVNL